jgi:hypothetical protein
MVWLLDWNSKSALLHLPCASLLCKTEVYVVQLPGQKHTEKATCAACNAYLDFRQRLSSYLGLGLGLGQVRVKFGGVAGHSSSLASICSTRAFHQPPSHLLHLVFPVCHYAFSVDAESV